MQLQHTSTELRGDVTVVTILKATLEGIDESEYPSDRTRQLAVEFEQAVADAPGSVVVDIRDTEFLNHSSVVTLSQVVRTLVGHGKSGVICCSSNIKAVLDIVKVSAHCPCRTSMEESLAALSPGASDTGC